MDYDVRVMVMAEALLMVLILLVIYGRRRLVQSFFQRRRRTLMKMGATLSVPAATAMRKEAPAIPAANPARVEASVQPAVTARRKDAWEAFINDKKLISAYRVTPHEIEFLKNGSLLGTVTCKEDILFILKTVRGTRRRA